MTTAEAVSWAIGETDAPLPPMAPGRLPFLGHALSMRKDPLRYFVDLYQTLGPIFRVQVMNDVITVMAGPEANRFTTRHDDEAFTNVVEFRGLSEEIGPVFTAMPPEPHRYMRRLMRPAYAKSAATPHLDDLIGVTNDFLGRVTVGGSFEVFPTMQEIVVNQLGYMMFDRPAGDYFEDFRRFMLTLLEVHQFKMKPRWMLHLPGYRKAKARAFAMAEEVLTHVRSTHPGEDRPSNAIDILLDAEDAEGQPFSEAALLAEAMAPYLAGQDTVAGTMAFICYTLHKYPDVLARVQAEVSEHFDPIDPSMENLRRLDTLHRAIVETMRRYPVAISMPRHAARSFAFAGYRVDAGAHVYSATAVTHFLPEFYAAPYTFDIDRPRGPSGSYAPFGVGNYTCLGAGIAEVQLLTTTAALLAHGRFELDPPDYEAKLATIPLPNPGRYRLRLVERY